MKAKKLTKFKEFWDHQEEKQKEFDKRVKAKVEANRVLKEQRYQELYHSIQSQEAQDYINGVQRMLDMTDEKARRKGRNRYHEWSDNVYGTIRNQILDEVSKQDEATMGRRRRKAYQEFLDVTNKKEALFRDIIIESEYDVSFSVHLFCSHLI